MEATGIKHALMYVYIFRRYVGVVMLSTEKRRMWWSRGGDGGDGRGGGGEYGGAADLAGVKLPEVRWRQRLTWRRRSGVVGQFSDILLGI